MSKITGLFSKIVGPAAVMAAGTMGAGAVATFILAGAWFRYDLLWVVVAILPLFVIFVDSASRIGLLNTDDGILSLIRSQIHPSLAWLILLINVPVHLLVAMGQMSVMTSALMSVFTFYPPEAGAPSDYVQTYRIAETALSLVVATFIYWLLSSNGYERMQKAMTSLMIVMLVCFLVVALRGFQELPAILAGFVPKIPDDLAVPGSDSMRLSGPSIMAIIGTALAPAALLGIPYMSADNSKGTPDLKREFRKAVINLGVVFGCYSIFVMVAGGFALYGLADHAQIDTVHEAGRVLVKAFPAGLGFLGPLIFSIGISLAALTTFVVVVQVVSYWLLDMLGFDWHDRADNVRFKHMLKFWIFVPAILAPFWSFPALLKVLLLMGVNALLIPMVMIIVIVLVNRQQVMGPYRANTGRNAILVIGAIISIWLSVVKLPGYIAMVF
ncbi:MAG: divalent metal cation transporter [Xanthomonadales bacterium]|nr:divalent metal cation transporter [Xanthomonadales bacterium]